MTSRNRAVTWDDPRPGAQAMARMGGLAFLRAMIAGDFPPAPSALLLGFRLVEVSEGFAAFELTPGEHQCNPMGTVHGGVAATVMDSALGCAVATTLPPGVGYTTAELHVNLVRPILPGTSPLRAEATVLHRGRTLCTAQCTLKDAEGKLYAHATTTCVVIGP